MASIETYFKKEFRNENLFLNHDDTSDFLLCRWQKNLSALPFLCIRIVLFLWCFGAAIAPVIISSRNENYDGSLWLYFIFMTNWGLTLNTLTNLCGIVLSLVAYFSGPYVSSFSLPWYVKIYYLLFNISVPWAFCVTGLYYSTIWQSYENYDHISNDLFSHAFNSVSMFILLIVSRHPTRILHFYQPTVLLITFYTFTVVFYFCGGINPYNGSTGIYPNFDWARPWKTLLTTVIFFAIMLAAYIFTVATSLCRDAIARIFLLKDSSGTLKM